MRSDFVRRFTCALDDLDHLPWLPGLTEELVEVAWRDLRDAVGLSPSNYGTARVLARSANAPRNLFVPIPMASSSQCRRYAPQVEILGKEFTRKYEESGVRFYSQEEIRDTKACELLEEALNLFNLVPSLKSVVRTLIQSIHLIKTSDDECDVSFSEPSLPFTIFVSVPLKHGLQSAVRVTEALLHEAMHLQLTIVEQVVALTWSANGLYFSPWRNEVRNAQGVVHALYVFRVIECFWRALLDSDLIASKHKYYLEERKREIGIQIGAVRDFIRSPELTDTGKSFVMKLIGPANRITT